MLYAEPGCNDMLGDHCHIFLLDQTGSDHDIDGRNLEDTSKRPASIGSWDDRVFIAQIAPERRLIDRMSGLFTIFMKFTYEIMIAAPIVEFKLLELATKPVTKRDPRLLFDRDVHSLPSSPPKKSRQAHTPSPVATYLLLDMRLFYQNV